MRRCISCGQEISEEEDEINLGMCDYCAREQEDEDDFIELGDDD